MPLREDEKQEVLAIVKNAVTEALKAYEIRKPVAKVEPVIKAFEPKKKKEA
jgi:hypothetical protein